MSNLGFGTLEDRFLVRIMLNLSSYPLFKMVFQVKHENLDVWSSLNYLFSSSAVHELIYHDPIFGPTITVVGVFLRPPCYIRSYLLYMYPFKAFQDACVALKRRRENDDIRRRAERIAYFTGLFTHAASYISSTLSPAASHHQHAIPLPSSIHDSHRDQDSENIVIPSNVTNASGLTHRHQRNKYIEISGGGYEVAF